MTRYSYATCNGITGEIQRGVIEAASVAEVMEIEGIAYNDVYDIRPAPQCVCMDTHHPGDNENCKVHGKRYVGGPAYQPTAADLEEGAESREASRMTTEIRSL